MKTLDTFLVTALDLDTLERAIGGCKLVQVPPTKAFDSSLLMQSARDFGFTAGPELAQNLYAVGDTISTAIEQRFDTTDATGLKGELTGAIADIDNTVAQSGEREDTIDLPDDPGNWCGTPGGWDDQDAEPQTENLQVSDAVTEQPIVLDVTATMIPQVVNIRDHRTQMPTETDVVTSARDHRSSSTEHNVRDHRA